MGFKYPSPTIIEGDGIQDTASFHFIVLKHEALLIVQGTIDDALWAYRNAYRQAI